MNKIINRIWMGNGMPEKYKQYGEEWEAMNPDWSMRLWTEDDIFTRNWHNQAILNKMVEESKHPEADMVAFWTHVADVVCPEIIYESGGVYLNTDMKPIKPLSDLKVNWAEPWIAKEDDRYAVNMAMYSPGGDRFFNRLLRLMPLKYFNNPGAFMNFSTGALLYEDVLRENVPVQLLDRKVFNPLHFSDFDYGQEPDLNIEFPEETIGAHAWGHRTNMRGQRILNNWE